jgi:peptidoglycan L-alanyl-D-glutamate endopeptidase CwlK
MDNLTLERIKTLHPDVRTEALQIYTEICSVLPKNVICRFAHTLRTFEEQNQLYAQGRTKLFDSKGKRLGIVTNAKGGQSYHNYGLAIDIVLLVDKDGNGTYESASWDINGDFDKDGVADWNEITIIFLKYGWKYLIDKKGKRWDFPHFQKTFGKTIKQLQTIKKQPGTSYPLFK